MMLAEKVQNRRSKVGPTTERAREQGETVAPAAPAGPKRLGGLVLARQAGESIMIGDHVEVEVVALKSGSARLRIAAPRSVGVHRREVFDAIRLAADPGAAPVGPIPPAGVDAGEPGSLVLTRREGQTIVIGGEVAVDVVEARPGTVRLRVIAPRSIAVHRREVYDAIRGGA